MDLQNKIDINFYNNYYYKLMSTNIYIAKNNTWYTLDGSESHEKGMVKNDWPCHLCRYNKVSDSKMFKIVGNDNFKICCHQCARMDMLNFLFDKEVQIKIIEYLKNS